MKSLFHQFLGEIKVLLKPMIVTVAEVRCVVGGTKVGDKRVIALAVLHSGGLVFVGNDESG